jgi:hypothetical protein
VGIKRPQREADHSLPPRGEFMKRFNYTGGLNWDRFTFGTFTSCVSVKRGVFQEDDKILVIFV